MKQWISEIRYQDRATQTFLGSPSIVRLPGGTLVASHDYFGKGSPKDYEGRETLTSIYHSYDAGLSWTCVTQLARAFWSSLFLHRGELFLLGTTGDFGHIVIRKSEDDGFTWTQALDESSGLLFRGGPGMEPPNYHCAPMPVLNAGGRLYRAFEDLDPAIRPIGFRSFVISCDADADLLKADNWTMSNKLVYDQEADPPEWGTNNKGAGWIEGNLVEGPDGQIYNMLRICSEPVTDKCAMVRVYDGGNRVEFDPAEDFVWLPGSTHKFTIRKDPETGLYWTLSNKGEDPAKHVLRETLSLFVSPDLREWRFAAALLHDDLGYPSQESKRRTGFQYVDFQFDGNDIIYIVRTAYDGANSFHDSNRIVFSRVEKFRDLAEGRLMGGSDDIRRVDRPDAN
ncbi:sialidase family protein [Paenibacillus hemerocallicola]|uniref:sialidase family protein n=1 Tax=Paenibacillus hemerocallicola TaxID=1172614 RepID=UPI00159EC4A8|nr:sialidase family protein [Paenibacillus hemerocallicola]